MTLALASAAFLEGYAVGKRRGSPADVPSLLGDLAALDLARRPFAFEGAAMAWEMCDAEDRGGRADELLAAAGEEWRTFLLIGRGCAVARLGRGEPEQPLVADGYGFQVGLTDGVAGVHRTALSPRAERGRGRALWFVTGGDAPACGAAIGKAPGDAGELWRGVGTACAFAGDPHAHADRLTGLAGEHVGALRLGVEQGIDLWRSLGEVPARTTAVSDSVLPTRPA